MLLAFSLSLLIPLEMCLCETKYSTAVRGVLAGLRLASARLAEKVSRDMRAGILAMISRS